MWIDDNQAEFAEAPDLAEDIRRLYVARIERGVQEPQVVPFQTQDGTQDFGLYGEIVLEADLAQPEAPVLAVRRLALYGSRVQKPKEGDDRYGVVSILGSSLLAGAPDLVDRSQRFTVPVTLHYRALSEEPALRTEDAEFPMLETMQLVVTFAGIEFPAEAIQLNVQVVAKLAGEPVKGLIQGFELSNPQLPQLRRTFRQVGTGEPRGEPEYSLSSHCSPPQGPFIVDCVPTIARWLPIKFVNFTSRSIGDLEPHCQRLLNRVCEVWRNQAGLDLTVVGTIEDADPSEKERYGTPDQEREKELETCAYASDTHVEVYICTQLQPSYNGGYTYVSGQAGSYCLVGVNHLQSSNRDHLLAHELGHVLGLKHPGTPGLAGSSASIMAGATSPNKHKNSAFNCRIFTMRTEIVEVGGVAEERYLPLNPIVQTTTIADCFRLLG